MSADERVIFSRLSRRMQQVGRLRAEGRTTKEIATQLRLADQTVRHYCSSLYLVSGTKSPEALAKWIKRQDELSGRT